MVVEQLQVYYKIVCISEGYEYEVKEEAHRGTLEEVHEFIDENFWKHLGCRWMLIPMYH